MDSLEIGFVFWNKHKPEKHNITSILHTKDAKYFISGTQSGKICIWEFEKKKLENKITPKVILIGHNSPITALVNVHHTFVNACASVSLDGTLCIWNVDDGFCYSRREKLLSSCPTFLYVSNNQRCLIAAGNSNIIEIVDLYSMDIIQVLSTNGSFVSDLSLSYEGPSIYARNYIISLGLDNSIYYWKLPTYNEISSGRFEQFPKKSCMYKVEISKDFLCNSVSLSQNQSFLLITTNTSYYIYDSIATQNLFGDEFEINFINSKAKFIDDLHFAVWSCDTGDVGIYRIYLNQNAMKNFPNLESCLEEEIKKDDLTDDENQKTVDKEDFELIEFVMDAIDQKKIRKIQLEHRTKKTKKNHSFHEDLIIKNVKRIALFKLTDFSNQTKSQIYNFDFPISSNIFEDPEFHFVCGTSLGKIYFWDHDKIDETLRKSNQNENSNENSNENLNEKLNENSNEISNEILSSPSIISSFSDGWMLNDENTPFVTCNYIISDSSSFPSYIIDGYNTGDIVIQPIVLTHSNQSKITKLVGHSSEITALLSPKNYNNILVSASRDLTIRIWDMDDNKQVTTIQYHSSPIFALFDLIRSGEQHQFFCGVAENQTIIIYDLDCLEMKFILGHPSPIQRIFIEKNGKYLAVETHEKEMYLWRIDSGKLDRIISENQSNLQVSLIGDQYTELEFQGLIFDKENRKQPTNGFLMNYQFSQTHGLIINIPELCNYLREMEFIEEINLAEVDILHFLSLFIPWGVLDNLDDLLGNRLGIVKPESTQTSLCIFGNSNAISIFSPKMEYLFLKWKISPTITAMTVLFCVAIGHALTQSTYLKFQSIGNELIANFCEFIPKKLENYHKPSLSFLSKFWQVSHEEIQQAAEVIIGNYLDHLNPVERKEIANEWEIRIQKTISTSNKLDGFLILAYLSVNYPDSLSKYLSKRILSNLLESMEESNIRSAISIRLIGRGFKIWKRHSEEATLAIRNMISLACFSENNRIQKESKKSLFLIGKINPNLFFVGFRKEMTRPELGIEPKKLFYSTLLDIIQESPVCLLKKLIDMLKIICLAFFSGDGEENKGLDAQSTKILNTITKTFPMIDYNSSNSRIIVGLQSGGFGIFDIKRDAHYKFSGHKRSVSAIQFNPSGKFIASYSHKENTLRIWKLTSSLFHSSKLLLKSVRSTDLEQYHKLTPDQQVSRMQLHPKTKMGNILRNLSLTWDSDHSIKIFWQSKLVHAEKFK